MNKALRDYLFSPEKLHEFALELSRVIEPPLHVTRHDGPGRFLVRSERTVDVHYIVELDNPTFPKGRCQCDDYGYRKEGKIRRRERIRRVTCKHIEAVHAELAHARMLCEDAGLPYSPLIIPTIREYEHSNRESLQAG